jgi:hypothetical protein
MNSRKELARNHFILIKHALACFLQFTVPWPRVKFGPGHRFITDLGADFTWHSLSMFCFPGPFGRYSPHNEQQFTAAAKTIIPLHYAHDSQRPKWRP